MFNVLSHWFALARTARQRRRLIESLSGLSDAQLLDIGLERGTIADQVRTGLPWQTFEPEVARLPQPILQGCG